MAQNARSSFYQASMLRMINQKRIEISPFSPPAGKKIVPFVTRSGGLSSARLPVSTTRMRTHVEPYQWQFLHGGIGVPFCYGPCSGHPRILVSTLYSIVNPGVRDFILLVPTPGQYIIPCVSTIY